MPGTDDAVAVTPRWSPWPTVVAGVLGGLAAGALDAAVTVGGTVAKSRGLGLFPLSLGMAGAAAGLLAFVHACLTFIMGRISPRNLPYAAGLAGAVLAAPLCLIDAFAAFSGSRAARIPGHQALSVGLFAVAVLAVAWIGAKLTGVVSLERRQRSRIALAVVSLAILLHLTNLRVLPRLYLWFHNSLGLLFVVAWMVAFRIAIGAKPQRRPARVLLVLFGVVAVGLWAGLARMGSSETVRFLAFDRSHVTGLVLRSLPGLFSRKPTARARKLLQPEDTAVPLPEGPKRRDADVILITIDALRFDHLGVYGYTRNTTPNLDAFARRATRFERAYAQAPHTSFSVASMLTGKYYPTIARLAPGDPHDPVTSVVRRYGWKTAALFPPAIFFTDADKLKAYQNNSFDFEYVKVEFVDAHARLSQVAEFFETEKPEKALLWVHYFEPHEPYETHSEHQFGKHDIDRYDGEIAYTDAAVGRLLNYIQKNRPGAIVIISADHGEEFDEHGGRYHGSTLYEEQIRVPLMISVPGVPARVVPGPVEVIDITPTVLGLLDIPIPVRMRGTDLGPWLQTPSAPTDLLRGAFAEVEEQRMVIWGFEKLICNLNFGACQYFDLATDPREKHNLIEDQPERVAALRAHMDDWLDDHGRFEPQLRRGVSNPDGQPVPKAIERGRLSDLRVVGDLFDLLTSSQPLPVRREAARLLVTALPERRATHDLIRSARANPDPEIRAWMDVAAARLGESDARAPLQKIVQTKNLADADLRTFAALALANLEDATGIGALIATLDQCPSVAVCRLVILALGKLRDPRGAAVLIRHVAEVQNRREMVEAMGQIADPSVLSTLVERLRGDEYVPVRAAAAAALAHLGGPDAQAALAAAAHAEAEPTVIEAIKQARASKR